MLGVGVGVAIAHPIAEGLAVAVGIAQMGWHLLVVGCFDTLERIKKAQQAVAFFGARQIQGRLG